MDDLIALLKGKVSKNPGKFLIGVDGFSGSGKSTLAKALIRELEEATLVQLDDFYNPETERNDIGRLLGQVLIPLSEDKDTKYQVYDWKAEKMGEWKGVKADSVVIIEGVEALHTELIPYYDFKIWVDFPPELGYTRGIKRDLEVHGVDNRHKWKNIWMPLEKEYVDKHNPKQHADFVVKGI